MNKLTLLLTLLVCFLVPVTIQALEIGPTTINILDIGTGNAKIKVKFPGAKPGDTKTQANCKKTKQGSFKCFLDTKKIHPIILMKKKQVLIVLMSKLEHETRLDVCFQEPTKVSSDLYGRLTVIADTKVPTGLTYTYHINIFSIEEREDCEVIGRNTYRCKIRENEMAVFSNENISQITTVSWSNPERPALHTCYSERIKQ